MNDETILEAAKEPEKPDYEALYRELLNIYKSQVKLIESQGEFITSMMK